MANRWEKMEKVTDFIFLGSKITADNDCSLEIKRCLILGRKAITKLDSILKSTDITLPTKVHIVKAMVFPVVRYGCESLTIKKAEHQRTDAFELWCWRRLLRVSWTARRLLDYWTKLLDFNPKGNQPWIFIGRTDAEAPILWPPDVRSWLIGKDRDASKDWGQKEKGATEGKRVGWHHWLHGHEFEQILGEGEDWSAAVVKWDRKESDRTEQLNNNKGCSTPRTAYHISQLALATTILSSRSDLIFFLWFVTDLRLSSEPVPEWLSRISFPLKKFLKQTWRKCKKECNDHPSISQHVLILGNISWMRITLKIWILLSLNTYCQIVSKKHCAKT